MKKIFASLLAAVLVLSGCSSQPAESASSSSSSGTATRSEYNFTIGTSATKDSTIGKTMQYAADLIMERTDGRISVTCYPDSQLGSDSELVEGVQLGNVTMVIGNTAPQVTFVPDLALFDLPNTYKDIAQAQKVLSNFAPNLADSFEGTSLYLCQLFPTSFRYMSSNKEIRIIDDFSGVQIRTMTNPYHMAYWNALGATATTLDFSELYIGLQQGLVDAQENPLDIFLSSKFYEQQDYIINTKHNVFVATLLMNQDVWDSLPSDLQEILTECFAEIGQYGTQTGQEADEANLQAIADTGVTIIDLDDSTLDQMREKAQPVYDMIREDVGADLVDAYLAEIDSSNT